MAMSVLSDECEEDVVLPGNTFMRRFVRGLVFDEVNALLSSGEPLPPSLSTVILVGVRTKLREKAEQIRIDPERFDEYFGVRIEPVYYQVAPEVFKEVFQ